MRWWAGGEGSVERWGDRVGVGGGGWGQSLTGPSEWCGGCGGLAWLEFRGLVSADNVLGAGRDPAGGGSDLSGSGASGDGVSNGRRGLSWFAGFVSVNPVPSRLVKERMIVV